MKRRLAQLSLAIGVFLSLIALLAIVRGFFASDLWALVIVRMPTRDTQINDRVAMVTNHRACLFIWAQSCESISAHLLHAPVEPFAAAHQVLEPRAFELVAAGDYGLLRRMGFRWIDTTEPAAPRPWGTVAGWQRGVRVPTWFVALLGAATTILPAHHLRHARRVRQRDAAGQCLGCGYDLRGADHDRCPECGNAVVVARVSTSV